MSSNDRKGPKKREQHAGWYLRDRKDRIGWEVVVIGDWVIGGLVVWWLIDCNG